MKNRFLLPALLLWSGLLATFSALNHYQKRHERQLLEPSAVQRIHIAQNSGDITLERHGNGWQSGGRAVRSGRSEQMLDILANCHSPQPLAALKAPPNPRPLRLTINQKTYTLGGYNSYHHAHYLDDGDTVWLCSENLKAMLAQPASSWFPDNNTAAGP